MTAPIMTFAAGWLLFFGSHLYSAFRPRGERDIRHRRTGLYMGLYSVISIAGLALLICGYAGWRNTIPVWEPPLWTRHLALSLMAPAFILLAAAYTPAGWIKKTVKHPMLAAVKLWAAVHLASNGDLASILLFGSFLAYAIIDRTAVKRRGDHVVVAAPNPIGDVLAVATGAGVYAGFLYWGHPVLIGVPVIG
jgi:uncharacterized membrane protein